MMENKIEEIARDICECYNNNGTCCMDDRTCDLMCESMTDARYIYEKGYRKQREGEWGYDEGFDCFVCNVCYNSALNNYRGLSVNSKFCPNCGAKMKGGAE